MRMLLIRVDAEVLLLAVVVVVDVLIDDCCCWRSARKSAAVKNECTAVGAERISSANSERRPPKTKAVMIERW